MNETKIIQTHYRAILSYCCMKLGGDVPGAEDCTQEVFLALHRKQETLHERNITGWLYAAADREVLTYRRKHPPHLSEEDIPEPSAPPEVWQNETVLDALGEDDRRLITAYYSGADRGVLAARYGLTRGALYQRIHRLRDALRAKLKGEGEHESKSG